MARHAAQQSALSDAAAAKNADALSFAAGQQGVDGADARGKRLDNMLPVERTGWGSIKRIRFERTERRTIVDGSAKAVQDAAQQIWTYRKPGVVFTGDDAISEL